MGIKPRIEQLHDKIVKIQEGDFDIDSKRPLNAFLHPDTEGAEFPQHTVLKPVDLRAQNLPMAGYAFRGNRRKYDDEQSEYMKQVALNHPDMKILAGGGGTQSGDIAIIKARKPVAEEDTMEISEQAGSLLEAPSQTISTAQPDAQEIQE